MNSMDIVKVGKNIAKIRRENNLTQEKVAEILDISAAAISRWENGHSLPDITLLPELARLFDCTIDHILLAEREDKLCMSTSTMNSDLTLANQIIRLIEGKNMIGMNDQAIINAFSAKHGHLGDVLIRRNRSTRCENYIMNSITVTVNGREYWLFEKLLFGDITELYRMKLISESGISIPMVYKIDFEERSILIEDLSKEYISGREYDEETSDGDLYRKSYKDIMHAVARFHQSFWNRTEIFNQIELPWYLQNEENFRIHIEGMNKDFNTFLEMYKKRLSVQQIQCFNDVLNQLKERSESIVNERFHNNEKLTLIHGDLNPSNVFVLRKNHENVKFIDMEAVRIGLPTEDLAMFIGLHLEESVDMISYLNEYYVELCKVVKAYSLQDFVEDLTLGIMLTMFHPIGIVGVRMRIFDEDMIKRAVRSYEYVTQNKDVIYERLQRQ